MATAWHDSSVSILLLLALLAVMGVVSVVAVGGGGAMADAEPDRSPRGVLPAGDVDRAAVDGLRFSLGLRGYRMDEVDDVLDRLVAEIELRDARIAELQQRPAEEV
jgi:DivIVA domain-containing protein